MALAVVTALEPRASPVDSLLLQVADGDRVAFDQLYRLTSARIFGLVQRVLRDPSQSEEVTQEVYLEVWRTAVRFQSERGAAVSWLLTMAHRRAIDRVRASQSSRDRDLRIGIRDRETEHDSVVERVEILIESARVRAAMAVLTVFQREAIELAYLGGRTQSEVAEVLGIPLSTAKTRLRDGLIRLRAALATPDAVPA